MKLEKIAKEIEKVMLVQEKFSEVENFEGQYTSAPVPAFADIFRSSLCPADSRVLITIGDVGLLIREDGVRAVNMRETNG